MVPAKNACSLVIALAIGISGCGSGGGADPGAPEDEDAGVTPPGPEDPEGDVGFTWGVWGHEDEDKGSGAWGFGVPCIANGVPGRCLHASECTGDFAPTPGLCPGPADFQCCTEIATGTCDPDAMPLPNAGLAEAPGVGGCPPGMAPVDDVCVDLYEASLVFDDDGSSFSPYVNPGVLFLRAVSIEGAVPQGYIDQIQAESACTNAGKRLCTDSEWLRACQGPVPTTYPYGNTLQPGVCNDSRSVHPAVEYFGTTDNWIYSELDNACLNQLPQSLDRTGKNPGCVTADGLYDMMGNLHEWTSDPAGTFRGGFYVDTVLNGPGCLYKTTAHNTLHFDYSTGFRCCAEP